MDLFPKILRWLATRPKTVMQTRYKLIEWGCDEAYMNEIIEQLIKKKYLDDEAYVQAWIYSDCIKKGKNPSLLYGKLKPKGIDPSLIETLVLRYQDEIGEGRRGQLVRLIRMHLRKGTNKQSMIISCQRQGFFFSQICEVCDELGVYQDVSPRSGGIVWSPSRG
ncbi:MAG: RecX family transcriptional regulator [Candidatus Absconditabacterales bacterium]|nr:RecX family transcriptional regulator [Candidatus Absconditabacterales bacterium]